MNSLSKSATHGIDTMLCVILFYVYLEFYSDGWPLVSGAFYFWNGVVVVLLAYRIGIWSGRKLEKDKRGN